MLPIEPPRLPEDDQDRAIECEFHLEAAFAELADAAVAAGWTEDEVEVALIALVKSRLMSRLAQVATEAAIGRVRRAQQQ
jgi:hypothetical protein